MLALLNLHLKYICDRINLLVILGENSMAHERLHWQSEVQKQQLQSEQYPEEINLAFMWSVTILFFVLLIGWVGVHAAYKCSFLNQNYNSDSLAEQAGGRVSLAEQAGGRRLIRPKSFYIVERAKSGVKKNM